MFHPRQTLYRADQRPSVARARSGSSASEVSLQIYEIILSANARKLSRECGLGLADDKTELRENKPSAPRGQGKERDVNQLGTKTGRSVEYGLDGGLPNLERGQVSSTGPSDARKPKRHSTKRTSLRGYAEAQWSRHEDMRDRILKATNVAKLEWEAKAALLHHSYPLAILLLVRAALLGSASACEMLSNLYAYGVTCGDSPPVTLVYRDALRSVAWALEALGLHERRFAAQIRAARSSSTPFHRLAKIWQGPLKVARLLVRNLCTLEVGAFDLHQKNAVFLPILDDLADSQSAWDVAAEQNTRSARQAPELWLELEAAVQGWAARLEAGKSSDPGDALMLQGPDEMEEQQSLATAIEDFDYHLRILKAIQKTRFLTLEPYAENVQPAEDAWIKAAAAQSNYASQCPNPVEMRNVLTCVKGKSGRLYDEQLFCDLTSSAQKCFGGSLATEYRHRRLLSPHQAVVSASEAKDRISLHGTTKTRDRLRDLEPADVETSRNINESSRPALTMRLSSGYAAPSAAVASILASGEQQASTPSGASASTVVRQKYGRTVSSSSLTSVPGSAARRACEPFSPTDSVVTGLSHGFARPRRPSSVVSMTPSLLFPPQDGQDRISVASDGEIATAGPFRRIRSSSSSFFAPRPRVISMYSTSMLVSSTSSIDLVSPSVSTTSQQNLHAVAVANPTLMSIPSRRRTGSNASLGSLNPTLGSILPKTSPSISEGLEASLSSAPSSVSADPAVKQGAAVDTLRKLKGRRSQSDLRSVHSARKDRSSAAPVPSLPATLAQSTTSEAPVVSMLQRSKSTVFVSLENLSEERSAKSTDPDHKSTQKGIATADSAMECLSRTQARISHQSIPSILEEAEAATCSNSVTSVGPPFTSALAAGALSGFTVDLLFFPIDTIKTRLQSAQGFWAAGGFSGVYRGLASTAVGSAPGAAVFFTTYESMKPALVRWMPSAFGSEGTFGPAGVHMGSASIAEVAACMIRVPTEVIKSRQQAMTYGKGTTTFQAFKKIFQEAGIRGYYRGFGSTVGREIPFTCIQFPLYERLKLKMARSRARSHDIPLGKLSDQQLVRDLPTWQAGLAGSIAGAIAAGLTTPLDVVKTRIMLYTKQAAAGSSGATAAADTLPRGVNTNIIPTLLHIGRTEGIKTLFSGFLPRTMWIGFGGAVFLGTFDAGIKTLP
ncbi:related to PET8 - Protein of the mitochondrial carrier family (MCF) [Melanopsichium pennsylvanicum]|uniref:Related to PET8 - Protein of the mitochondrial carrier family (MCF) n=2 Tax=Melanopsichium pennsylvanicum TaxID=63383 RepID=A0AAJ4XKN5_9BASI|nr:related to PET8-Protein of the mitochondrial carrier family (MCF) [Melanopsichium pennsylvanicum 4]SNX83890.1 related to PET8 - Protein of the mitochondrial carrier family (MCF) [Melanopsichium pennsylvanicum]